MNSKMAVLIFESLSRKRKLVSLRASKRRKEISRHARGTGILTISSSSTRKLGNGWGKSYNFLMKNGQEISFDVYEENLNSPEDFLSIIERHGIAREDFRAFAKTTPGVMIGIAFKDGRTL